MTSTDTTEISAAFNVLLGEIQSQIDLVNSTGGEAFEAGNYIQAKAFLGRAMKLVDIHKQILVLKREWIALRDAQTDNQGSLSEESGTSYQAFYLPICQALEESGGTAEISEVLDRVEEIMSDDLKPIDYKSTSKGQPRWRVVAQNARFKMVRKEGLLRKDSPIGTWEISDRGRAWLQSSSS